MSELNSFKKSPLLLLSSCLTWKLNESVDLSMQQNYKWKTYLTHGRTWYTVMHVVSRNPYVCRYKHYNITWKNIQTLAVYWKRNLSKWYLHSKVHQNNRIHVFKCFPCEVGSYSFFYLWLVFSLFSPNQEVFKNAI